LWAASRSMARTILYYAVSLAVLVGFLKFIDYRFIARDISLEIYLGLVALFFTVLGTWAGTRLSRKKAQAEPFKVDEAAITELGITQREYEVLLLIAEGLSNQEIADKLFVSLNTVKTHSSNLFSKLDASRRTQALQRAKELNILN